jgi:hypothetical protein
MADFALNVYYPSKAFLDGGNPYDQSTYLANYPVDLPFPPYAPVMVLLHLPFAWFSFHVAAALYFLVSVVLTILLACISLRFSKRRETLFAVCSIAALIVLSRPGRQLLVLGQPAMEFILASYVALYYADRAPRVSGVGLALSLTKMTFGLPLLALMLAQRQNRRAVMSGVVVAAVINLPVSALLASRAGSASAFLHDVLNTLRANQSDPHFLVVNPATSSLRVDVTSLISRIIGYSLQGPAQLAVTLAVLALAAVAISRTTRLGEDAGDHQANSIICVAVLLSVYHQAYDLVLLTMPFLVAAFRRLPAVFDTPRFRLPLLGLYTMLAANYVASYTMLTRLHLIPPPERASPRWGLWLIQERAAPTGGLWLLLVSLNSIMLTLVFGLYLLGNTQRAIPADERTRMIGQPQ